MLKHVTNRVYLSDCRFDGGLRDVARCGGGVRRLERGAGVGGRRRWRQWWFSVRGDHDSHVPRHRLQPDRDAQRVEPRHAGGGRTGGAPILAAGRNPLQQGPALLPVLHVRAHLHRGLPAAAAGVSQRVRARAQRLLAADGALRLQVARSHVVRKVPAPRRPPGPVHGQARRPGGGPGHLRAVVAGATHAKAVRRRRGPAP